MTVTESWRTVRPGADLTISTALATKDLFLEAATSGEPVQLDLSEVEELDTAGLQLLLALRNELDTLQLPLRVSEPSAAALAVFQIAGLGSDLQPKAGSTTEGGDHVRG